jgi:hypothetical protein
VDQTLKEARAERGKGKRMWLSVAGVVTVLSLVAFAAIYFSTKKLIEIVDREERQTNRISHPLKPTTSEVAVQPSAQPTALVAVAIPSPSISATPTKKKGRALDDATKDHPWVNSLGMKFVPVAGTQVLFSVWDTRVQDFEAFVKSTDYDPRVGMYSLSKDGWKQRGATWRKPGFSRF